MQAQAELFAAGESAFVAQVGLNNADDSLPYSTAELNAPEYSTDDFRMFSFKVRARGVLGCWTAAGLITLVHGSGSA